MRCVLGGRIGRRASGPARVGHRAGDRASIGHPPGRPRTRPYTPAAHPLAVTASNTAGWCRATPRCDLYNGAVMAKIYRSAILSLSQGHGKTTFGARFTGARGRPEIPSRVVPRMTRPILTQLVISPKDPTRGEVVSHPHAARGEHTLGSVHPLVTFQVAAMTGATPSVSRGLRSGSSASPARVGWRCGHGAALPPDVVAAGFQPAGLS